MCMCLPFVCYVCNSISYKFRFYLQKAWFIFVFNGNSKGIKNLSANSSTSQKGWNIAIHYIFGQVLSLRMLLTHWRSNPSVKWYSQFPHWPVDLQCNQTNVPATRSVILQAPRVVISMRVTPECALYFFHVTSELRAARVGTAHCLHIYQLKRVTLRLWQVKIDQACRFLCASCCCLLDHPARQLAAPSVQLCEHSQK